jgi:replicative DNA helicase
VTERVLPHSLDAERAVLGAILVRNDALYEVGATLRPTSFYRKAHERIYAAMVTLAERAIPSEFVTLKDELQRRGELDDIGGPAYIAGLADGVPSSTNVTFYARIVREKAILRDVITASRRVTQAAYDAEEDAVTVVDEAERALLAISQDTLADADLLLVESLLPATMALLEAIAQTGRPVTGLSTGWPTLDAQTRGLHPGNLIVLGGRPGDGKSALALQLALHVAKTVPVAFFSMEMNRDEIVSRALAQIARVDHHRMMQGYLNEDEQRKVGAARLDIESRALAIDDSGALTPFQIRSKAKKLASRKGLGFVVVDYLQLLQRPRQAHSREEAVADNTWALKVLAGELKVPVLALSQLNRSSAKEDRRPTLVDLRESGAVEQHANVVLLIYKPPPESNGVVTVTPTVELLIAKQRNGPQQGKVDMVFNGPSMRFEEMSYR